MTEDEFLPLFDQYHNMVYRIALVSIRSQQDADFELSPYSYTEENGKVTVNLSGENLD